MAAKCADDRLVILRETCHESNREPSLAVRIQPAANPDSGKVKRKKIFPGCRDGERIPL